LASCKFFTFLTTDKQNQTSKMETAFLKIVDEHQAIIFKISRMYRDTLEDQEDLFQEIVFQLWKSFPTFRNESKVSTWMYRIALNTAIALFRKSHLPIVTDARPSELTVQLENDDSSEQEERMYWALRQLNSAEKAIIALYLDDYSYSEIASTIGVTENNVGVRINRIKSKLKIILTT
jgi:RNA polymerase sigma factor (sigma-70 family)